MSLITGKINITALQHALQKTAKGNTVIIIPVEPNNLYLSDKGNVYLDFSAFDIAPDKRQDRKDTHIISQSLPKDLRERMKEANQYSPTLGNLTVWEGHQEQAPNRVEVNVHFPTDDLPF